MSDEPAIDLQGTGLGYRLARHGPSSLKAFAIELMRRHVRYERHQALSDVTLQVRAGEILGVVGANGAGKSTLMKVIAGILPPTEGRVVVRGHVAAMIELGAGFSPDLTGRENIVLYGALLGRPPALMRARLEEIAAWADLTEFLDVPIRTYSSGMLARLAFAICTDTSPEVLIVDEILSVGDAEFSVRSGERMDALMRGGAAVVLVSHDLPALAERATRAIWLDGGRIAAEGEPHAVIEAYGAAGRTPA
ncbi:MAG: ABC transporter ATP-binding protein [Patulibacter sp.]